MKKKIRASMFALSALCVLIAASVLTLIFYDSFEMGVYEDAEADAALLKAVLEASEDELRTLLSLGLDKRDDRVTLIAPDGQVLFDNYEPAEALDNHLTREEVSGAIVNAEATSDRYSDTLHTRTHYYAARLESENVLRVAKTRDSVLRVFLRALGPSALIVLALFGLSAWIAGRMTATIIRPINEMNLSGAEDAYYEELAPLYGRIAHQSGMIGEQIALLEERANTIQALIDDMREGLILLSGKGEIAAANASALALFQAEDARGKNILEITRDRDIIRCVHRALKGTAESCLYRAGGRVTEVYFSPVSHGREGGATAFFLDVTEKACAEKIRREFSANVSHELKTPLTVIAGLSEMLSEGMAAGGDGREFAEKIRAETRRLQALIDDIIRLSQLDEGGGGEMEMVDLSNAAHEAACALAPLSKDKGVIVSVEGEAAVQAQRQRMVELFFNLIDNGIKYNRQGGEVRVRIANEGARVSIAVRDTGIGIPKESLPRVFERFYRVDPSRSKLTGGTGLGLSIVKHIALLHGGSVEIESEEGQFTEVRIHIIARRAND